jgi:folate-binding protein YgfZ
MVKLPYLSAVRFSGADAGDFLHNQLSNDVLGLADGESVFACYCEPKGRVLALVLICKSGDDFYAVMARDLAEPVTSRLRMYVLRAKVEIEVQEAAVVGLEGKSLANAEESVTLLPVPGTNRSLLLMDTKTVDPASDDAVNAWKASELRQGITWLGPETSGQFLPQWLGFDELGAVNFRKGCYPGQEIVARTKYLGKVKRHPRLLNLELDTCPAPMERLELSGEGQTADAVAVDCVKLGADESLLFMVTRLDPDTSVERVEYQDQSGTAS